MENWTGPVVLSPIHRLRDVGQLFDQFWNVLRAVDAAAIVYADSHGLGCSVRRCLWQAFLLWFDCLERFYRSHFHRELFKAYRDDGP